MYCNNTTNCITVYCTALESIDYSPSKNKTMTLRNGSKVPYEFSNIIMILVCILTLLWLLKASLKFYRTLRIRQADEKTLLRFTSSIVKNNSFEPRAAFLTERIVEIRGISSYLSYFEGATSSHVNSIVHTRQSKAPVSVSVVYNPFIVTHATAVLSPSSASILKLNPRSSNHYINNENSVKKMFEFILDVSCTVESRVVVLLNFQPSVIKKRLQGSKLDPSSEGKRLKTSLSLLSPSIASSPVCHISTLSLLSNNIKSNVQYGWGSEKVEKAMGSSQVDICFAIVI